MTWWVKRVVARDAMSVGLTAHPPPPPLKTPLPDSMLRSIARRSTARPAQLSSPYQSPGGTARRSPDDVRPSVYSRLSCSEAVVRRRLLSFSLPTGPIRNAHIKTKPLALALLLLSRQPVKDNHACQADVVHSRGQNSKTHRIRTRGTGGSSSPA